MDDVLTIGPLMFATDRLLAVALIGVFLGFGAWVDGRTNSGASRATWIVLCIGIVAARLGYVAENYAAFAIEPWTIVALWQGGFTWWVGVIAAAVGIVVLLGLQQATAMLLASLALIGLANVGAMHLLAPPVRPFPQGVVVAHADGQALPLDGLRGQPFVINLWATWCAPCRREMPMLIDVVSKSDVPVLLVNQGEALHTVSSFLKRENLAASRAVLDPDGALGRAVGAQGYPTTLFVDAAGNIRRTHAGEISRAALTEAIRELEDDPRPASLGPSRRDASAVSVPG